MEITCRRFTEVPAERYRLLTGDAFFVSPAFAGLWRAREGEPCVWCADRDGDLVAVLPGVEFRRGPVRRFASMPDGCYGGVFVAAEAEAERHLWVRALLAALARRYAIVDVFDFRRAMGPVPGYVQQPCEARLVTLSGPDWMPADPTLVHQAQKAAREGIRIEPFDVRRHLDGAMRLADATARAHRCRQRYPRPFFEGLARLARDDRRIVWRWCERDGVPVASQIYVAEDRTIMAWQSFFDRRFSFLKPNQAMRLEVVHGFASGGGHTLNLGSTPARATGLAAYKKRWGGRIVTYPDHRWSAFAGVPASLLERLRAPFVPGRARPAAVVPVRRAGAPRPG